MKSRLKKKIEKRERLRVHRMLEAVLKINGLEDRTVKKTGTLPTAFFYFSGHVGIAKIDIHMEGWDDNKVPDIEVEYSTSKWLKKVYPYPENKLKQLEQQVKRHEI